jgi:excisionase family DNA binding protein
MSQLLTTKDLALALGVSESSLRRWTNDGSIATARTPGGHRRIALAEAIRFIRQTRATVVRPELLGLPPLPVPVAGREDPSSENLLAALLEGDAARARGQLLSLYLAGAGIAGIADGPIRFALERIGDMWRHDRQGIAIEHRATDICLEAVGLLRHLLPTPEPAAPLAMGGAPPGDPYILPSALVAAVLAEAGWREVNFGPEMPVDLLGDVALARQAQLVWLSLSAANPEASLRGRIRRLAATLAEADCRLMVGGRAAAAVLAAGVGEARLVATLGDLAAEARTLLRSLRTAGGR